MPYTNPATVTHVEYPIIGGKDTKNVKNHNTSHPPGVSRQRFAAGLR